MKFVSNVSGDIAKSWRNKFPSERRRAPSGRRKEAFARLSSVHRRPRWLPQIALPSSASKTSCGWSKWTRCGARWRSSGSERCSACAGSTGTTTGSWRPIWTDFGCEKAIANRSFRFRLANRESRCWWNPMKVETIYFSRSTFFSQSTQSLSEVK